MKDQRRRPSPYRHRQRHGWAALCICLPLSIVAITGCILALKEPLTKAGVFVAYDPWPFIYDLHRGLVAGWPGRVLISVMGLGLWFMVTSGTKSYVRLKGRKPSMHALLGIGLGIPIALIASLGALLNFVEPLSNLLDPIPVVRPVENDTVEKFAPTLVQISLAEKAAGMIRSQEHLRKIYQPKPGRPYLIFYYDDNTRIYIDPGTAKILKVRTSWSHWTSALLPLHSLRMLGMFGNGIMFILGLSLTWLTSRGVVFISRSVR
jgi:uncharacterized iron-regulated membrane protein